MCAWEDCCSGDCQWGGSDRVGKNERGVDNGAVEDKNEARDFEDKLMSVD